MNTRLAKILLFIIIAVSFFLRVYKVTSIPPALNWDETSIAYNAYSILKTGKDEWGQFMPLHFKSFGEYKLPAQIYASIPGIAIFGLNEIGVRITPAIYGVLTVLLLYFLLEEAFKIRPVSLMAAFLLAVSPWHIQLTRASFESSFALFWIMTAVWFLIKGLKKPRWLLVSMLPFAVSVYTYNSARVFTPLFLFFIAVLFRKYFWKMKLPRAYARGIFSLCFVGSGIPPKQKFLRIHPRTDVRGFLRRGIKKWFLLSGTLLVILLIPLVPFVLSGEAGARYKLVSITDEKGLIPRINERRGASTLPGIFPRLIHNKVTYLSFYFARNYLAHFTPNFLFIKGAGHKQHHVQGVGELYWIQAPFLLFGLYYLLKKRDRNLKILLPWLLLAFVPVAMTNDSTPNALRTLIAVPVYQIFTALGVYYFFKTVKNKKFIYIVSGVGIVLFLVNFSIYLNNYFVEYPLKYSRDWQYGNRQVVEYIKDNQDKYDLITFTRHYGEPHMFTLFYLKYDPSKFQNSPNLERFETYDWVRVLRFDKYYFPDLGDSGTQYQDVVNANPDKKILFIGKPGDFSAYATKLKEIYFLNGEKAFEITQN